MQPKTQSAKVVSTRVQPPAYEGKRVTRDRLIDVLRAGRAKRLALVHGPAGFGKSTLALQWQRVLAADEVPVAWVSLDRGHNDVVAFLGDLIAAVGRVEPTLVADLGDLLEEQSADAQRYVQAELVNRCAGRERPLAIVLDDWHLIESPDTAAALDFLLTAGPDNLHLVVTSRTRAPGIGRLKVSNQVVEIDAAQLRFDQQESAAFLLDLNELDLDGNDVHSLWSSTDGWVSALQLATLSLRTTRDAPALIRGFSGRHHSIGDYLAENVLDALPDELLDFLLTTSICDRLCGDLAAAVSGQPRGQAFLEELERRDMFLQPLDDDREWFRYHHLFGGYLRQRLERDHADQIVSLHRRASAWFADQGLLTDAVSHALAAGDDVGAVDLVERQAMYLVEHSRMAGLLGLVNKLPKVLVLNRPMLQTAIAWANCLLQRPEDVQIALSHVRAALASATDASAAEILGEADVVQACTDVYGDRIDRAASLVAPYIVESPRCRPFLAAVSANIRTFVDIHTFAYDTALARQQWANAFHETAAGPFAGVYGRCFAGLAAFAQLDLRTAEIRYAQARALAHSAAGPRSHATRLAGALLGRLRYERGDIDTAEALLEECHELGVECGVADFMIAAYSTLAHIKVLRGDIDDAISLLNEGAIAAQHLSLPRLSAALDYECLRLHLAVDDIDRARQVLARQPEVGDSASDGIAMATRHYQLSMQARILCASDDYDAATKLVTSIRDECGAVGCRYAETISTIELARVVYLTGDSDAAAKILVPALIAGARSGLLRTVVDAGPEILKIIVELREARRTHRWAAGLPQVATDYLSALLTTAHTDARKAAIPVIAGAAERTLPEQQLNAREIEVLRLLDRGLSNKQIARSLGVTINTVKWYLKSIYVKLGVARRGESIAEARRRRLLP
ncbi:LuxR C-terminal-related transcriptional regulator [Mycobacterium shigaense]|uniref:Serine/threonine-protein kinase PknK n=1 Tax=Mycobacterium shigaense TaxID=722731 RepID=A0A1Z4ELH7_9MYCO|nr:LuxR C-terminal-related transcriptional regulator [Mycobacterium shigaense]MEA1121074.1 LuxR C-terminal-related transcriptional regulator [Mycobacterium shigaense]PRI14571.1 LuxR family transcriptional regulator [Mycobacterium shigaense]BAX93819.1 serine/threonine-protein kinase PknK [Mycobacterium shigaense]